MQVRCLLTAVVASSFIGCSDHYSGSNGELQKSIFGNNEYILVWERTAGDKSDTIAVKLRWKVASVVKREFQVASYDKMAMPKFKIEYDKITNQVTIIDAYGSRFEFKCE